MQIRFTPHKLRASKAYISNLIADDIKKSKVVKQERYRDKKENISLFRRFLNLFK